MNEKQTHWDEAQTFERDWWGSCTNTYAEEVKQLTYAYKMGLPADYYNGHWPVYALGNRRILDIGGGPVSILLKGRDYQHSVVADPCDYPVWVTERYEAIGIDHLKIKGEDLTFDNSFDEAWIYNVLQHVEDPEKIISNAYRAAPVVRIFEWIDIPPHDGHPQMLTEASLNMWLNGKGSTEVLDENYCVGRAFYGIFDR